MDERCFELISIALDHKPCLPDIILRSFVLCVQHEASSQDTGVYWDFLFRTTFQVPRSMRPWISFLASMNFWALGSLD